MIHQTKKKEISVSDEEDKDEVSDGDTEEDDTDKDTESDDTDKDTESDDTDKDTESANPEDKDDEIVPDSCNDTTCTGSPCEVEGTCRSKWNSCGASSLYCNVESLWKPCCADKEEEKVVPGSCNGSTCRGRPCDVEGTCRSKWNSCGASSAYCNAESLWKPCCEEEVPDKEDDKEIPESCDATTCNGRPCDVPNTCRSKWDSCGASSSHCNSDSEWKPCCAALENEIVVSADKVEKEEREM